MKKRCTLCGGKVLNGICSECGMDNRKSDEQYKKILEQRQAEKEARTHAFRKEKKEARQKVMNEKKTKYSGKNTGQKAKSGGTRQTYTSVKKTNKNTKKKKGVWIWVLVFLILAMFGDTFLNIFTEVKNRMEEAQEADYESTQSEYDPYSYVEEEIRSQGEYWKEELSAGLYVVGADLPEGVYTIKGEEGNSYSLWDRAHGLSVNEYFGTEDYEVEQEEGAKLFQGALIEVNGMSPVIFETENGQTQNMTARKSNPLTESFEFSDTAVAGIDFSAGTYDVEIAEEGSAYFSYEIQTGTEEYDYPNTFSALLNQENSPQFPDYCTSYKNVVIPEGVEVSSDGIRTRLTPSEGITTEDYESFYDNLT
ncbi:MAG TPA: hypothetical protein IAA11_07685 [Candidatus Blautia intestinigallinarum]|nr:hypothetical protein [Candidatus Cottocaccamicrobium excrementipullorum]HIV35116.1 hypothetical protein [Candidatus Blautia intestinigallinarum]